MCCEYPRPNVDAVYTSELDDYIAALAQGAKAIDKDNWFLQDKVLDITGPLCMLLEHLTPISDLSSKDITLSQDQVQSLPATSSLVLLYVWWEMCPPSYQLHASRLY